MYKVLFYTRNRELLGRLERVTDLSWARRPNEATRVTVTVPRTLIRDQILASEELYTFLSAQQPAMYTAAESGQVDKSGDVRIAMYIKIFGDEDTDAIITARISEPERQDDVVVLKGYTEEILLEGARTPAQYGRVLDGLDLADAVRHCFRDWETVRIKAQSQWESAIEAVNVDTATEPGLVILDKGGSGAYYASGHITLRFETDDYDRFARWDRIRWLSDNQEPVTTTMQYRYGPDAGNMGAWSDEIPGALPDEIGVVPGTVDAAVLDVRINLYTSDTESENPEGDPVGQTPAVFALEVVARTPEIVTEGDIPASTGVVVTGVDADDTTALRVIRDMCAMTGYEFRVVDGALDLADQLGEDRTGDFVFRAGTNTRFERDSEGDKDLVNILRAYGPGDGIDRMQITRINELSRDLFGDYPGSHEFETANLAELESAADAYLIDHALPIGAYRIIDLFKPDERPVYSYGDIVKVVDPRTERVFDARIIEQRVRSNARGTRIIADMGLPAPDLVERWYRREFALAAPQWGPTPLTTGVEYVAQTTQVYLTARWRPVRGADRYEVRYRGTEGWTHFETSETLAAIRPVVGLREYTVQVRALSARRHSDWSEAETITSARDTTPPADPAGVHVEGIVKGLAVSCDRPTEPDWAYTEFAVRPAGGAYTTVDTGKRTHFEWQEGVAGNEYQARLRHVDTSGNESGWEETTTVVARYVVTDDTSATTPDNILPNAWFARLDPDDPSLPAEWSRSSIGTVYIEDDINYVHSGIHSVYAANSGYAVSPHIDATNDDLFYIASHFRIVQGAAQVRVGLLEYNENKGYLRRETRNFSMKSYGWDFYEASLSPGHADTKYVRFIAGSNSSHAVRVDGVVAKRITTTDGIAPDAVTGTVPDFEAEEDPEEWWVYNGTSYADVEDGEFSIELTIPSGQTWKVRVDCSMATACGTSSSIWHAVAELRLRRNAVTVSGSERRIGAVIDADIDYMFHPFHCMDLITLSSGTYVWRPQAKVFDSGQAVWVGSRQLSLMVLKR